ncbi:D-alanine--D-alanine ligase family protein [Bacillus marinisedimentorum]|uniref:D-alanine--D-alanine ligase family protein n=1 Tax=Bacillus marinisedimentorum TaxID=1821260 RepID=UPI000872CAD4|nr:D-alanine--D-alanine ligase [Bacillus marinisedimentorum]
MNITVLYGGVSAEREVSLSTGKGMMKALEAKGHEVAGIDFHPSNLGDLSGLETDFVFIALHGRHGEDGRIQGFLDMIGIPYVGSGVLGSALAMDKAKSKRLFELEGIRIAKDRALNRFEDFTLDELANEFAYPAVVKPNHEGSTIGLTIANSKEELRKGIEDAFRHDDTVLVEEFVAGREVTVAVMGKPGREQALPVVEIIPKNKFYDYEAKYSPGMSEHIVPAELEGGTTRYLKESAVKAHRVLGCEIYSRVDFIVPEDGSKPVILEVNTLPGMTPTSLFPDAAREIGLSYDDMIEKLLQLSVEAKK